MSLTCTVGGVDKTAWAQGADLRIHHSLTARPTLTLTFEGATTYRPARHDTIAIANGATTHFGGVITRVDEDGPGTLVQTTVEATGYACYADWCYATYSHAAGSTLKDALTDLVTTYLSTYGIALDAGQPADAMSLPELNWERAKLSQVLDDLAEFAGGYVWRVDASKNLLMYAPGGSAAAWNITDATVFAEDGMPVVAETDEDYADKITLICGDTSTESKTQSWTADGLAHGGTTTYITDYPATADYIGYVTVGGIFVGMDTLGWSWNASTHTLSHDDSGGLTPGGTVISLTYTAQYPFVVDSTAAPATPHEAVYTAPDVFDLAAGRALATAYYNKLSVVHHEIRYGTYTDGLLVGTKQTITLTQRNLAAVDFLITDVEIARAVDPDILRYDITALEGSTNLPGWATYWKSLGGSGATGTISGGTTIISGGGVPVTYIPLGGSTREPIQGTTGPSYGEIQHATHFQFGTPAHQGMAATIEAFVMAPTTGVSVAVQLYDNTTTAVGPASAAVTSTAWSLATATVPMTTSVKYCHLRAIAGTANEDIYVAPGLLVLSH